MSADRLITWLRVPCLLLLCGLHKGVISYDILTSVMARMKNTARKATTFPPAMVYRCGLCQLTFQHRQSFHRHLKTVHRRSTIPSASAAASAAAASAEASVSVAGDPMASTSATVASVTATESQRATAAAESMGAESPVSRQCQLQRRRDVWPRGRNWLVRHLWTG